MWGLCHTSPVITVIRRHGPYRFWPTQTRISTACTPSLFSKKKGFSTNHTAQGLSHRKSNFVSHPREVALGLQPGAVACRVAGVGDLFHGCISQGGISHAVWAEEKKLTVIIAWSETKDTPLWFVLYTTHTDIRAPLMQVLICFVIRNWTSIVTEYLGSSQFKPVPYTCIISTQSSLSPSLCLIPT